MAYAGGWEGDVKIGTDLAGMRSASPINLQDMELEEKNNLEEIFKMGARSPQALKEGLINIAGKLAKYYEDNTLPGYAHSTTSLTTYVIGFYPFGYTSTKVGVYVSGKFDSWKISGGVGKITDLEMPFKATSVTFDTVP